MERGSDGREGQDEVGGGEETGMGLGEWGEDGDGKEKARIGETDTTTPPGAIEWSSQNTSHVI